MLRSLLLLVAFALIGAHADAASLTLAWDPPTDTTTRGYVLWYGTAPGSYSQQVDVGLVSRQRVDGLAYATTYCFAVRAYDAKRTMSEYSNEVCMKTDAAPPTSTPPPTGGGTSPPPDGGTSPPPSGDPTNTTEIVLYASKASVIKGHWSSGTSSGAAGGNAMRSTDTGWSLPNAPLAAPTHYFETTFNAAANTPYRIWMRLRAGANSKWNDSVWVQFSDALVSGQAAYRIGTTSGLIVNLEPCDQCGTLGWGWHNGAYWLAQETTVSFAQAGVHTIRVQTREDGVEIDQIVISASKYMSARPGPLRNDATILAESAPVTSEPPPTEPPPTEPPPTEPPPTEPPPTEPPPTDPPAEEPPPADPAGDVNEIVLHASDASTVKGNWAVAASSGAAGGKAVRSTDRGLSVPNTPLASPADYFDVRFNATANTAYRVWLRLRAGANSKLNDSVWVQFSDSLVNGKAAYRIGTSNALLVNLERCNNCGTSGWGWLNSAYWMSQTTIVTFAESGAKTIRVQIREDGVEIDQIVLSAVTYKSTAPGAIINDATILSKTQASAPAPAPAPTRTPYSGTPIVLPGTIDATHFDQGGAGVAYFDTTAGNSGGVFRATDVDLQASAIGGYNIAWTAAGEWLTYTVNVQAAGTYTAQFRVASVGGGAVTLAAGSPSNDTRNVAVPDTRGWQSWTLVRVPITLAAGQQTITLRFMTANVNVHSIAIH